MAELRTSKLWLFASSSQFKSWQLTNLAVISPDWQLDFLTPVFTPLLPDLAGTPPLFLVGQATAPAHVVANGFDSALLSWNAVTPPQTWLEFRLRVKLTEGWSAFYRLGIWSTHAERYSVDHQADQFGAVATDILFLKKPALAFQPEVLFYSRTPDSRPLVNYLAVTTVRDDSAPPRLSDRVAWGCELVVPEYSQMLYPEGEGWCSPTSLVMVLGYWAAQTGRTELNLAVPSVAEAVFDPVYDGCGNWPFNTAYAASLGGLLAYATFLTALTALEKLILQGIPVIVSLAYKPGQLYGTPLAQTAGHLLVVRGFDRQGNVITNDPAANPAQSQLIRTVYDRQQFECQWLTSSGGGAYVIFPEDWNSIFI